VSASPVTLDMSTAKPIAPQSGVTLDMSTAKPIGSKDDPGFLDKEVPLTSYKNATLSGVQSLARGARDAGVGLYDTFRHPIHTAKGLIALPEQAAQIPAAIHDINESADPAGTYAKVAQETAGQGAPQALIAAGMETAIPKVVPPVVRGLAKGTNKVLERAPGLIGSGAGAAIGHATGIPEAGPVGAAIGYGVGKELLPKLRVPGETFRLPKPVYPGAPLPETPAVEVTQARALTEGGHTPPPPRGAALGNIPAPEQVAPPVVPRAIAPAEVQEKLGEALGNKPVTIKPGVKIRDQFKTEPQVSGPEGHTTVESSAVKSFKYDPAARELHVTAKDGTVHVYGEVTPDQADAFANADSKGQAWKAIRDNNVKLAKISPQGVRTANKGAMEFKAATPDDLTPILTKSLAAAKKAKP
jgi:hypothetical protein